jgi:hypothetical protein
LHTTATRSPNTMSLTHRRQSSTPCDPHCRPLPRRARHPRQSARHRPRAERQQAGRRLPRAHSVAEQVQRRLGRAPRVEPPRLER